MKFLCTKVKTSWLTSTANRNKVLEVGLEIKDPFIGIEVQQKPSENDYEIVQKAIKQLFSSHIQAFPIKLIDL